MMGQSLAHSFTVVAETDTYQDVQLRIAYESTMAVQDSVNTFIMNSSNGWPNRNHSRNINVPSSGGQGASQLIYDETIRISKVYGSTTSRSFSASMTGIAYWGSGQTITTSGTHTVPARPVSTPSGITQPVVNQVTENSARSTWQPPTNWGGDDSNTYDVQRCANPDFTGGTLVTTASHVGTTLVLTGLASNTDYWTRTRARNSAGVGNWSNPRKFTTTPAAPAAPSGVSPSRNSDTSHGVSWTRNATSGAPYASQQVQRRVFNGSWGSWATIANLSGAATSVTDTSTQANRAYQYRVVATNSGGSNTSDASATVYTTPSNPTGAKAVKNSADNIVVSWTNTAAIGAYQTEVWRSQSGGAYTLLTTVNAGQESYTHTNPSTLHTHQYRVRHKTSTGTALFSGYSTTSVVQLAAPPNAPSGLGPSGTRDATLDAVLEWTHNAVDSSPQAAFELRHSAAGESWTTVPVTSETSEWTLPGGTYANGTTVEWQVSTKGQHPDYSPWSATASFLTSTPPTATINEPSGTLPTSTVAVQWGYFDADGDSQSQWRVTLLDDELNVLEVKTGSGEATEALLQSSVADQQTYTVRVEVRDSTGMWSAPAEFTFDVDYLPPPAIVTSAQWHRDSGTVVLYLTPGEVVEDETIPAVSAVIERRINGGEWLVIAEDIDPDSAIVDTTPITVGLNEYRTTAISELPSTTIGAVESIELEEKQWSYLSAGPGFTQIVKMWGDPKYTSRAEREKAVHHFAGREKPVEFSGESIGLSVGVSGVLTPDSSSREDIETLAKVETIVLWRDQSGRRLFASIAPASTADLPGTDAFHSVSFNLTEVDHVG